MLLNEFLKEHRRVEEQGCEVQEQKSTISELKITVVKAGSDHREAAEGD